MSGFTAVRCSVQNGPLKPNSCHASCESHQEVTCLPHLAGQKKHHQFALQATAVLRGRHPLRIQRPARPPYHHPLRLLGRAPGAGSRPRRFAAVQRRGSRNRRPPGRTLQRSGRERPLHQGRSLQGWLTLAACVPALAACWNGGPLCVKSELRGSGMAWRVTEGRR